ncbi:two-component system, OmpR family, KDP operon response regulator KdpE [Thermanaeromonas toyohensis ToBE]|uniref:Stage 0 sporulation protein A homolog n=1 Tax=Thermanaeromonas toyohensis ToBE TaxID=698762 RepID=A0A1W1W2G7_9FIRM|nr:response regulator [Thermanaeromonas toyohensis]SMB99693.1 two-component system, OmpR family, KDP operon response regulator KdpE [Thermanaeromonas toyohensis ToBE]
METKGARVLVIDDELQIRRLLKVALSGHGYQVEEAATGEEGLEQVALYKPDVIILDLGLPDMDGLEVIKRLREWSSTPVIILSVREHEADKIQALDAGADDYVTKPFSMGELLARIRAALRHRAGTTEEPVLYFEDLKIDLARRRVTVGEEEVKLTPTEYELLKNLALNAGKVLTHRQLLRAVWGPPYENEIHYLRVYIGQLRRKIEADPSRPRHLITEPGVGYRLL